MNDLSLSNHGVAGKVLLLTGASSGIGYQCARHLAEHGARVVLTGRRPERVRSAASALRDIGLETATAVLDVSSEADWQRVITETESMFGRIDGILSNAGECVLASIEQLSQGQLDLQLRVNVEGNFLAIKHGISALRRSGGGQIVVIGSAAALRPSTGSTAYSTSKAALIDLVRLAASEGAAQRPAVQVYAIHPGMISGDGAIEAFGVERAAKLRQSVIDRTPVGRIGHPEEVSVAVEWLFSGRVPSLSSNQIVQDGGFSIS